MIFSCILIQSFANADSVNCPTSYYQDNSGLCLPCGVECNVCGSPSGCSECNVGSFLVPSTGECFACSIYCVTCSSFEQCEQCSIGFYLDNGRCARCGGNCQDCSVFSCNSCKSGFFLVNGQCEPCSGNCAACPSSEVCDECEFGYNLQNGKCEYEGFCVLKSPIGCLRCFSGLYLNDGKCLPCEYPCQSCTSAGSCNRCQVGFSLDSNNQCEACPENCLECDASGCVYCDSGFFFGPGSCEKCEEHCLSCFDSEFCDICDFGFFAKDGKCEPCGEGCNKCESENVCSECLEGYFNFDSKCELCPQHCSVCDDSQCYLCENGFYFDDVLGCTPAELCQVKINSQCLLCNPGAYLFEGNCISNLYPCGRNQIFSDKCYQCMYGYFLSQDFYCKACDSFCGVCQAKGECKECYLGFFLNENGKCDQCGPHCDVCESSGVCKQCSSPFDLVGGDCVCQSIYGCVGFDFCGGDLYFDGFGCKNCRQGCKSCTGLDQCIECYLGFELVGGICVENDARRV